MRVSFLVSSALLAGQVLGTSINITANPSDTTKLAYDASSLGNDPHTLELDVWTKALCRGQKLYQAMCSDEAHSAPFTPATDGGPNICFHVKHYDGPSHYPDGDDVEQYYFGPALQTLRVREHPHAL